MAPAHAGITVYKGDDGKYVKIGGRIQVQYHLENPDTGSDTDELFFRRLRPYIEGSLHEDWMGKFQFDLGKAEDGDEIAIKDAYLQYKGFRNTKITIGNANFPFSRELLTSSKYQQLVERTFVGDHNHGTPDRNLGVHVTGHNDGKTWTWGASLASASIDPDSKNNKLDFDTPVNRNSDFNEGWMAGGRIDFHPQGGLKMSQGDFERETKSTIGIAGFHWANDGDNNTKAGSDVDQVTGFEVSVALRAKGFSVDAEYNVFDAKLADPGVTSGMYVDSETELENWTVEGGYMVVPGKLELVLGYESQDADGYADAWTRKSVGLNYFFKKHDIKVQASYRMNEDKDGASGNDLDELFIQAQYVF